MTATTTTSNNDNVNKDEKKSLSEEQQEEVRKVLQWSKPPIVMTSSLESASVFTHITKLNLPDCNLSAFPKGMPQSLPNLSILFCPKNNFQELPAVIGSFPKLQMVSFKSNQMKSIHPDALQSQMRWLILTDNALESIPSTIGRCQILQKLMLSGNNLKDIPSEISKCTNLELVRLASNQLQHPPMELLQLPKLSWIALSANPFLNPISKKDEQQQPPPQMALLQDPNLEDVEHGQVLGTGASGITKQVTYKGTPVAVKHYFGEMTSDGDPKEERQISLVASSLQSPSLIQVLGQTSKGSLVMELLQNVQALADPPSLESCSRDVYSDQVTVSEMEARTMVTHLLKVLEGLHAKGICHGDFYGHNILVSPQDKSNVKLSDFGAAWFYDTSASYAPWVESIEIKAFGHFVEEICVLLDKNDDTKETDTTKDDDDDDQATTTTTTETSVATVPSSDSLKKRLQNLAEKCVCESSFSKLVELWWTESPSTSSNSSSMNNTEEHNTTKRQKIS